MRRWLCGIAVVATALGLVGCHVTGKNPEPFNPEAATVNEVEASEGNPAPVMHPLPTTLHSPYSEQSTTQKAKYPPTTGRSLESGPTVRMTLHEIIQRAVANNLDVKVAGYQPAMDEARVVEAEANFDPTFFTNLTYSDQTTLTPSSSNIAVTPGQAYRFRTWGLETGIKQNLQSGGQLQIKYDPAQTHESLPNGGVITPNPFWTSDIAVQLTQPLLRDFGYGVNQARIAIARNNQQISLLDFRDQLEKTLRDIEDNYWQLVQAEGDAAIADQLLTATLKTADVLIKRRGQDVTRVEISQTNSAVETRRAALISARAKVRDFSDQLKRLMDDPEMPVTGPSLILPATVPLEEPVKMNLQDLISTAMDNRFELGQQLLRMDSTSVANQVAKNNLLPQLNLVGSVGVQGFDSNWLDAAGNQFSSVDSYPSWSVGLQFELPIGNRAARAIWKRTLLQRQQAIAQYQQIVDQVSLDVKTAWRDVETKWEEMEAARAARFAAADALKAVEQREEGGEALTYTFVQLKLDTQQRYADAQAAEVQAISDYNRALMKLEFAKGTLLRYNNVVMEEAPIQQY